MPAVYFFYYTNAHWTKRQATELFGVTRAGNGTSYTVASGETNLHGASSTTGESYAHRIFIGLDTSTAKATWNVKEIILRLHMHFATLGAGDDIYALQGFNWADPDGAVTDYQNQFASSWTEITHYHTTDTPDGSGNYSANISTTGWTAWVNCGGTTKISLVNGHDFNDTAVDDTTWGNVVQVSGAVAGATTPRLRLLHYPETSTPTITWTGSHQITLTATLTEDDGSACNCYFKIYDHDYNLITTTSTQSKTKGQTFSYVWNSPASEVQYIVETHAENPTELTSAPTQEGYVTVGPSALTRVTGLTHRYKAGHYYRESIYLGGLSELAMKSDGSSMPDNIPRSTGVPVPVPLPPDGGYTDGVYIYDADGNIISRADGSPV